jgi:hypothetical protein
VKRNSPLKTEPPIAIIPVDRFSRLRLVIQTLLLTAVVFAFFTYCYGLSVSDVLENYYLGGDSFLKGENPYEVTLQNGPSNQFKYSPFFALVLGAMAHIKFEYQSVVVALWLLAGMGLFSFGLSRWCNLSSTKAPLYVWFALVATLLDLITSLIVHQSSALIVGLALIALAEYRDRRFFSAGIFILLATNLKTYPVIFLLALGSRMQPRYWWGLLIAGLSVFFIPSLFVGFSHNTAMHLAWVKVILNESSRVAVLNLPSAFARVNLPGVGQTLYWLVLIVTLPVFFSYPYVVKTPDWRPWMTIGLSALLMLNRGTEVFTYVFLAPTYLLMAFWCAESAEFKIRIWGGLFVTLMGVAIASCRYTIPRWSVSENPFEIIRGVGAFGLWSFAAVIVGKALWVAVSERQRNIRA